MIWRERANCAGETTEIWYPHSYETASGREIVALAKSICADCPVSAACLTDALAHEAGTSMHRHGIWGGLTPTERAALDTTRRCVECDAVYDPNGTNRVTCSTECAQARHARQKNEARRTA